MYMCMFICITSSLRPQRGGVGAEARDCNNNPPLPPLPQNAELKENLQASLAVCFWATGGLPSAPPPSAPPPAPSPLGNAPEHEHEASVEGDAGPALHEERERLRTDLGIARDEVRTLQEEVTRLGGEAEALREELASVGGEAGQARAALNEAETEAADAVERARSLMQVPSSLPTRASGSSPGVVPPR